MQEQFSVSDRRICDALNQPRSTQRYQPKPRDDEAPLAKRMREHARRRLWFGYRRIAALLRAEDRRVSDTRAYRLWRREGLRVPQKAKRRRLPAAASTVAIDFAHSCRTMFGIGTSRSLPHTTSGSQLKWLSIVDEFTRECPIFCASCYGIASAVGISASGPWLRGRSEGVAEQSSHDRPRTGEGAW